MKYSWMYGGRVRRVLAIVLGALCLAAPSCSPESSSATGAAGASAPSSSPAPLPPSAPPPAALRARSSGRGALPSSTDSGLRAAYIQTAQRDASEGYALRRSATPSAAAPSTDALVARNDAQDLALAFDEGGVVVSRSAPRSAVTLRLSLQELGRAGARRPVAKVSALTAAGNRVEYARAGGISEWYVNGPLGLEQGFTLAERPAGAEPLQLAIGIGDALRPKLTSDGQLIELSVPGGSAVLRYGELYVQDARGDAVPARLAVDDGRIVLSVDDAQAAYPIAIDPLVWVETRLERPGDLRENALFGISIAADSDFAVIGAPGGRNGSGVVTGAVYVFKRAAKRWALEQKLVPSDGAANDGFGAAVAISGNTILVGALPVNMFYFSGAGYVFVYDGNAWSEVQKLTPMLGSATDEFGGSVALQGDEAFIGAWTSGAGGAAYYFKRTNDLFAEVQTLLPDDVETGARFGYTLDFDDDTLVIGAFSNDERATDAGAAYVFVRDGAHFRQSQKLLASNGAAQDDFGLDFSIDGDTLVVGADLHQPAGMAYVFERSAGPFVETQRLVGSDLEANDRFGLGITVQGDTALIGAMFQNAVGAAYLFRREPSGFVERAKLEPDDVPGRFGRATALAGNTAFAGAMYDNSDESAAGSVYAFEREGSDWLKAQKLEPGQYDDGFGLALGVSGQSVIAGLDSADKVAPYGGTAYVYTRNGGAWTIEQELVPTDPVMTNDSVGTTVAIDGDTALVGAPGKYGASQSEGAVYVFVRGGSTWTQQAKLVSPMPINLRSFGRALLAIDGDTALATQSDGMDGLSPVFVFTRSGTTWGAPQVITPPGAASVWSYAIDGDTLAIASSDGTTRMYERASGTFAFTQSLPNRGDVSLDGDTLAIGKWDYMNAADLGQVVVYTRSAGTWTSTGTIAPPSGTTHGVSFADSVALSGNTLMVSATGLSDGAITQAGGGYVYTRSAPGAAFTLVQQLKPSHPSWTRQVGIELDLDGQIGVIGGFWEAYVFEGINPGADGDACYLDTECQNAHCVDGICCNDGCSGACQACSQFEKADGSADGTCGLVAAGLSCGPAPTGCFSQTAYRVASTCSAGGVCQANSVTCADSYACVGNASSGLCVTSCLNQGVPDHGYCAGSHYCDAGDCVADKTVGSACSQDAECESDTCTGSVCRGRIGDPCGVTQCAEGFCVDGYCCGTICNGTCEACGESGQHGTCVAVTGAPRGSRTPCVAEPDCGGSCDGVTRNACTYPGNAISCDTPSCTGGALTNHHCNGGGGCVAGSPQSCTPYLSCESAQSCANSCSGDADCVSNHFCDDISDTCLPDRMQAMPCDHDAQCLTGACADGVCCNTDCGEQCEACAESGKVGTCSAVTGSPRGSRVDCTGGGTACEGSCDGAKHDGCVYPAATSCGSSTCSAAVAYGALCNGQGACVTNSTGQSCFPYAACADGTECLSSCAGDSQCVGGRFCDTTGVPAQCVAQRTDGAACDANDQCLNGFCVDGVCCNTECTGQCEACAEPSKEGMCVAVSGTPRGSRTACAGTDDDDNVCAGSCDGATRDACDYPAQGTACADAACDGAVLTPARVCDGSGVCGLSSTQDCGAYGCDPDENQCNTRCESRGDCAAGALCRLDVRECAFVPSVCIDAFTVELADGTQSSCGGHRCTGGECQQRCGDDNDCAPDYVCTGDACVPQREPPADAGSDAAAMPARDAGAEPSPVTPAAAGTGASVTLSDGGTQSDEPQTDSGCGCRVPGERRAPAPAPASLLAACALAALRLRRRRRL